MATDVTSNPWSVTSTTTGVLTTRSVILKKILWDSPTTDGHTVNITDKTGAVIYNNDCIAGGTGLQYGEDYGDGIVCNGITVVTHQSGTIYLYIQ